MLSLIQGTLKICGYLGYIHLKGISMADLPCFPSADNCLSRGRENETTGLEKKVPPEGVKPGPLVWKRRSVRGRENKTTFLEKKVPYRWTGNGTTCLEKKVPPEGAKMRQLVGKRMYQMRHNWINWEVGNTANHFLWLLLTMTNIDRQSTDKTTKSL